MDVVQQKLLQESQKEQRTSVEILGEASVGDQKETFAEIAGRISEVLGSFFAAFGRQSQIMFRYN